MCYCATATALNATLCVRNDTEMFSTAAATAETREPGHNTGQINSFLRLASLPWAQHWTANEQQKRLVWCPALVKTSWCSGFWLVDGLSVWGNEVLPVKWSYITPQGIPVLSSHKEQFRKRVICLLFMRCRSTQCKTHIYMFFFTHFKKSTAFAFILWSFSCVECVT